MGRGAYLAITVVALVVVVWLSLQIAGVLIELGFLAAAAVVAAMALRAWRSQQPG